MVGEAAYRAVLMLPRRGIPALPSSAPSWRALHPGDRRSTRRATSLWLGILPRRRSVSPLEIDIAPELGGVKLRQALPQLLRAAPPGPHERKQLIRRL